MAQKPIFCVTHPRACSTAFERVFMTRRDLACVHEPFGDAFYFGPERMGVRYEDDEEARKASGFANSTYKTIFERLEQEGADGKRIFIKDIIHYLLPPDGKPPQIAPSLISKKRGIGTEKNGVNGDTGGRPFPYGTMAEPGNPTVIPSELLRQFHFTFLIRDPHYSIPSYYRCTIPPLDKVTGFYQFYPSEAGYDEVRRVFDYLVSSGVVGPTFASAPPSPTNGINSTNGSNGTNAIRGVNGVDKFEKKLDICVIDADDLLDNPKQMIEAYCQAVGLDFTSEMLHWEDEDNQTRAREAFEKWRGFHEDAIDSTELRARKHKKAVKTEDEYDREWAHKYGLKGANIIRQSVDANIDTYRYLKQFALKVSPAKEHPYDDTE